MGYKLNTLYNKLTLAANARLSTCMEGIPAASGILIFSSFSSSSFSHLFASSFAFHSACCGAAPAALFHACHRQQQQRWQFIRISLAAKLTFIVFRIFMRMRGSCLGGCRCSAKLYSILFWAVKICIYVNAVS